MGGVVTQPSVALEMFEVVTSKSNPSFLVLTLVQIANLQNKPDTVRYVPKHACSSAVSGGF